MHNHMLCPDYLYSFMEFGAVVFEIALTKLWGTGQKQYVSLLKWRGTELQFSDQVPKYSNYIIPITRFPNTLKLTTNVCILITSKFNVSLRCSNTLQDRYYRIILLYFDKFILTPDNLLEFLKAISPYVRPIGYSCVLMIKMNRFSHNKWQFKYPHWNSPRLF